VQTLWGLRAVLAPPFVPLLLRARGPFGGLVSFPTLSMNLHFRSVNPLTFCLPKHKVHVVNKLSRTARAQIIQLMVEGNSVRPITRITGRSINTVLKLLADLGAAADEYQDSIMRNLDCKALQVDEIWSFVHAKNPNVPKEHHGEFGYGDVWTFVAIEADTKLVPAWMLGERSPEHAAVFMHDLKERMAHRVQLTTDGHRMYLRAVPEAFGDDIDFAQFVKIYGTVPPRDGWERNKWERTTGQRVVIGSVEKIISGDPDGSKINTAFVERQNLTMRMGMRRFTRASNGHSKKLVNHAAAQAIHFMHYNFARPHKSLANPYPRTPAMAAGLADHVWSMEEIAALLD
jgi:IS1 family transposase